MCKMWREAGKWAANKMWNWKIKINWWNFSTKISSFSFISSRHSDETRSNTVCLHTAVEFFPIDFSLSGASSDGRGRDHRRLQHKSPYTLYRIRRRDEHGKAIATLARKQGNATDAQRSVQLLSNDGESMEEWTFRAPHKCTLNFYQCAEKPQLSIKIALDALRVVGKIEKSEGIPRAASNEMENCRIKNSKAEVRKFYYGKAH